MRSDAELREWIRAGGIERLREHPIGRYFVRGQRVAMPAYQEFMPEGDLSAVMRYVQWVNGGAWQRQPLDLEP